MKKRFLFYKILPYLKHKNTLVITGMRQVGKTTLMRQLYDEVKSENKLWFDFDNPLDQKVFEDVDYRNIYYRLQRQVKNPSEKIYIFIDEIQNYPEITKVIKYLMDHFSVKFIVTGSSNFYLKNLFPESLSGRKFLYHLSPLTFYEYLYFHNKISLDELKKHNLRSALKPLDLFKFKKFESDYEDYLVFGGFPEVVVTENVETKRLILKNIFASFFEKDLRIISDYKDIRELRDLILLLVPRVGSMLQVSKLASELGVSRVKVYEYLEFLQGTFFIHLLSRYSKSVDRSVAGGKKVYFSDTGILNIIGSINEAQLFENAVVNQLRDFGEVSFYHRSTAEIDVILDRKIAFEVKITATPEDYRKLARLSKEIEINRYYLISKKFREGKGILTGVNF